MFYILINYLLIGLFAGTLSGLLGIGGGTIIVPTLAYVFVRQNVDENTAMRMAVSSSLAIMMLTSQASVRALHKHTAIDWNIYKTLLPGIFLGVLLGHLMSTMLSGHALKAIFAIFLIFVSIRMLGFKVEPSNKTLPGKLGMSIAGLFIGGKSGLLGIGGGTITIPFLTYFQISMRQAITISALVSFTVASLGATVNLLESNKLHHQWMTGYIYWPAVLLVTIPSMLAAKFGAHLSAKTNVETLRKIFAILLLLTAIELILR